MRNVKLIVKIFKFTVSGVVHVIILKRDIVRANESTLVSSGARGAVSDWLL